MLYTSPYSKSSLKGYIMFSFKIRAVCIEVGMDFVEYLQFFNPKYKQYRGHKLKFDFSLQNTLKISEKLGVHVN